MLRQAWLFVRGDESIRVTTLPMGLTLLVCGPGSSEHSHHFDRDETLEDFRRWYEERLVANGWRLDDVGDRRSAREGLPPGQERRRSPRT